MQPSRGIWSVYLEDVVVPTLDVLQEFFEQGAVPWFQDLDVRAQRVVEREYERKVGLPPGEEPGELASAAEDAQDEAISWYATMVEFHHGLNCLLCVALSSEVEKFLGYLYRYGLLTDAPARNPHGWGQLCKQYGDVGIDLKRIPFAEEIAKVRLVANALKHGPGDSLEKLNKKCPDPRLIDKESGNAIVLSPDFEDTRDVAVADESVRVKDAFVREAFASIRGFLREVVERLPGEDCRK